jgi:hypothetical protein
MANLRGLVLLSHAVDISGRPKRKVMGPVDGSKVLLVINRSPILVVGDDSILVPTPASTTGVRERRLLESQLQVMTVTHRLCLGRAQRQTLSSASGSNELIDESRNVSCLGLDDQDDRVVREIGVGTIEHRKVG